MAVTRIGELVFEVDADGRVLERSVRRIGKQAGLIGGKEAGDNFNSSFGDSLSDLGEDVLNKLRARSRRKGAEAGRITGRTFSENVEAAIRGRLNSITKQIADVFAFNGNEGFERWRTGFDSVGDAADRMAENLDFARDEGRLTAQQYDRLRDTLDDYTESAYKVERAEAQVLQNRRALREETARLQAIMANNQSFERYVKSSDNVNESIAELRRRIDYLKDAGDDDSWSIRMSGRLDLLSASFENNTKKVKENAGEHERSGRLIKSHVGRVIALWTGLVLAIGEGTATLGSGVGAAMTSLLGSIAVAITGAMAMAGAAIAGFAVQITLAVSALQQMKDVVPEMQGALDNLNAAWEDAGRRVAEVWGPSVVRFLETITGLLNNPALLDAMAGSLAAITDAFTAVLNGPGFAQFMDALTNIIPGALTNLGGGFANIFGGLASVFAAAAPALAIFAEQFNAFWGNWATKMQEATADGSLQEFFMLALDSMNALFGVIGALTGALSTLFTTAAPYGNQFLGIIQGLLEQWDTWMQSIEGQEALKTWFEQGLVIMQAVFDLAGQLGAVLGALVTPESVERLLNFIEGLGEFLPIAGQILEFFGRLDILNIFVGILNLIGEILTPLMPTLLLLAQVVGEQLVLALDLLAPAFARIGEALAPVVMVITEIIVAILPSLIEIIVAVVEYIATFVEAIFGAEVTSEEFAAGVKIVGQIVGDVFKVMAALIITLLDGVSGAIKIVSQILRGDFSGAFETAYQVADRVMTALGWDIDELISFFDDLFRNVDRIMGDIGGAIEDFGGTVADIFGGVIGWIQDAIGWFGSLFGAANDAASAGEGARGRAGGGAFAAGGILNGPRRILAGEAGPEAIVPLRRNLSMVDPSVRWLSALAQGRTAMANGGIAGASGKTLNVAPGAIVVQEVADGRRTANNILTRLVEHAAG